MNRASLNAQEGISLIQTAEGALSEMHSNLQRIRELNVQNCNDSYASYKKDPNDPIQGQTLNLQVGALSGQNIPLNIPNCRLESQFSYIMGPAIYDSDLFEQVQVTDNSDHIINGNLLGSCLVEFREDISHKSFLNPHGNELAVFHNMDATTPNTSFMFQSVDGCIANVSELRSYLGATQNRLEHTVNNLNNTSENTQYAESRIRDTDMAKEMVNFSANSIIAQTGQAMLTQATKSNEGVMQLLQ